MKELDDLRILMESRFPLILLETWEEDRALQVLSRLAMQEGRPLMAWDLIDGLRRCDLADAPPFTDTSEPQQVLEHIRKAKQAGIFALCDFHPFLRDEPRIVRLLKDIGQAHERNGHTVVLVSHQVDVPPELSRMTARFELSLPDDRQLMSLVQDEARDWQRRSGKRVRADRNTLSRLVANLKGLTLTDARRLARGAIVDDGAIADADLPEINKTKFQLLDMEGVLSFEYDTSRFSEVGGLANLKSWLEKRRDTFVENQDGPDKPRGILLVGVQGGGKSLAARAVAGMWGLPLLRLDMGAIYNKFFGESERNVREALKLAESMSPCVLWIDEIEKGVAVGENDGGTSRRVLGTLLTWMAERKAPVFMVATANEIDRLPPELIRKGRLDELFFVDLPAAHIREDIFRIHLRARGHEPAQFQLDELVEDTDGFTGAEIEQAVIAAAYAARARGDSMDTADLLQEVHSTVPLSVTMAERLQALRDWCRSRAVPADGE